MSPQGDIRGQLRRPAAQPTHWADPDAPLLALAGRIALHAPAPAFRRRRPDGTDGPAEFPIVSSTARLEGARYAYQFHVLVDRNAELGAHVAVLTHDDELRGGGRLTVTSRHRELDEALGVINDRVAALIDHAPHPYPPKPGTGPVVLTREQVLAEARLRAVGGDRQP